MFNFKNVTELNQLPSLENNSSWTAHRSEERISVGEVCNGNRATVQPQRAPSVSFFAHQNLQPSIGYLI